MRHFIFIISYLFSNFVLAQSLTLDGGSLSLQNGSTVTVNGTLHNKTGGNIDNKGTVTVQENIVNNGGNTLFLNGTGTVLLNGATQYISGQDSIVFYDLILDGTQATVKELFNTITVLNSVNLNEQELQLHNNKVYVLNTNPNAIIYQNGFVSGDTLGGYLLWQTNSTLNYEFPVGNGNLYPFTRPVIITPNSNDTSMFAVRLAYTDLNNEITGTSITGAIGPFDTNLKDSTFGELNTSFYHNIAQINGNTGAKVKVLYTSSDGNFKNLAQWTNGSFSNVGFQYYETTNTLDRYVENNNVLNFNDDIFVLTEVNIEVLIPAGISVNNDGLNDVLVIENLDFYPNNQLNIYNRWGDLVYSAANYQNDWSGQSTNSAFGNQVSSGTYFYTLVLEEGLPIITGYIELKK